MDVKVTSLILTLLWATQGQADGSGATLPVLYRVDQPTSNVVVFRGDSVALAQAAGLIKSPVFNGGLVGEGSDAVTGNLAVAPEIPVPLPATTPLPPPPKIAPLPPLPLPTSVIPSEPLYSLATLPPLPVVARTATVVIQPPASSYGPAAALSYAPAQAPSYVPAPVPIVEPEPAGPVNYNWEYAVQDDQFNDFGHKETRDGFLATGKYYVNLPDGRTQIVTYTADANGYVPVVEYTGVAQYPDVLKPTYS